MFLFSCKRHVSCACHAMQNITTSVSCLFFLPPILLAVYEILPHSISMEELNQKDSFVFPSPPHWITKQLSSQVDLIYNFMASIFSPFNSLFTVTPETKNGVGYSAVHSGSSDITSGSLVVLKKLGLCLLSAAYVCMILFLVLILAAVLGVGLVRFWVEEPLFVKENLHFDYTDENPTAVFSFHGGVSSAGELYIKKKHIRVPVGHTFSVSLSLLMPESDFNRDLGVFQLTAELLSVNGSVIAKSSQPCMLRFRSSPIRLARTVMMGVPLVLGISAETQKINVDILRHKEDNRRTNAIRVTLHPRAGTSSLPQLYEAEIVMNSNLPWAKELIRNWKWTFYVWVSLYVYILLLTLLLCCYRPLIFMVTPESFSYQRVNELTSDQEVQVGESLEDESEVSELLRKWRSRRSKRKTIITDGVPEEETIVGSSASTTTREDVTSTVAFEDDDTEDSESVCIG